MSMGWWCLIGDIFMSITVVSRCIHDLLVAFMTSNDRPARLSRKNSCNISISSFHILNFYAQSSHNSPN